MSGTENPFQSNITPENDSAGEAGGSRSVVRNTLSTGSQTTVINATEAASNDNDPPTLKLRLTNTNDPNETEIQTAYILYRSIKVSFEWKYLIHAIR